MLIRREIKKMTKQEIKEFIIKHLFEEMEFSNKNDFSILVVGDMVEIDIDCMLYDDSGKFKCSNGAWYDYARKTKPKQMRYLTIEEIWGRTLVHPDGRAFFLSRISENGCIYSDELGNAYMLEDLIDRGWKVNDKPSLDGAQDLKVEVSGE